MIGARGDCLLAITTDSELLCSLETTRQVVGVWPFNCLRRYWCGEGVFGFEAGKRSPRGEGTFTFTSLAQDEEIYATLKKYIDRAKQVTLQRGNKYGSSGVKAVGGMQARPKFPLPDDEAMETLGDAARGGGAGVEELSYAQVPSQDQLAGRPRSVSPYERRASLHHTDVSAPNPMYMLKRSQTAKPRMIQQWVEQTEAAAAARWSMPSPVSEGGGEEEPRPLPHPPLPPLLPRMVERGSPTLAEEDMYSHTQHVMPAPFQHRASEHNIVEESTYHTLVHDKCSPSLRGRKEGGGGGEEGEGEGEGAGIYSVAYPPDVAVVGGRRVHVAPDEYGTLDLEAVDKGGGGTSRAVPPSGLNLTPAPCERGGWGGGGGGGGGEDKRIESKPGTVASKGSVPLTPGSERGDLEDSMTENLLYNTHADVLMATASVQTVLAREEGEGGSESGTATVAEEREKVNETDNGGSGLSGGTKGSGGVGGGEEGGLGAGGGEGVEGGLQRDAKGYTKVDKSKKQQTTVERLDSEGPPPPIPPRLYEGAEDAVGLPPHSPLSPTPPTSDIIAGVSDV